MVPGGTLSHSGWIKIMTMSEITADCPDLYQLYVSDRKNPKKWVSIPESWKNLKFWVFYWFYVLVFRYFIRENKTKCHLKKAYRSSRIGRMLSTMTTESFYWQNFPPRFSISDKSLLPSFLGLFPEFLHIYVGVFSVPPPINWHLCPYWIAVGGYRKRIQFSDLVAAYHVHGVSSVSRTMYGSTLL